MESKKEELLLKLREVYYELDQDMQFFKTGLNFTRMLLDQGHQAESIACYLVLHCGVYAAHNAIVAALIKHEIVTD